MSYPKNKEEWWALVDGNWEDLLSILGRFLPMHELAYDPPGKTTGMILPHTGLDDVLKAKKNRDGYKLCRYLNGAWAKAPDKPWIRDIPGWFDLCDLCSESYVLDEEPSNERS